jgi:hypothetical protein
VAWLDIDVSPILACNTGRLPAKWKTGVKQEMRNLVAAFARLPAGLKLFAVLVPTSGLFPLRRWVSANSC